VLHGRSAGLAPSGLLKEIVFGPPALARSLKPKACVSIGRRVTKVGPEVKYELFRVAGRARNPPAGGVDFLDFLHSGRTESVLVPIKSSAKIGMRSEKIASNIKQGNP
jgi:hypothetical protein